MMDGASWADIQKLASDLQRIQLGEASKRLSDRNCIELVSSLRNDGIIDIVYSTDGREYITRCYLKTQICNETLGNGGRIELTNLAEILGVEYQHIEDAVRDIIEEDNSFVVKVGQLISADYIRTVCEQINAWLADDGTLTISQITKAYDLPSDYLLQQVNEAIDKSVIRCIRDSLDGQRIYTSEFIARQKALTRGVLSAITSPFPLKQLVQFNDLHGSLLFDCIDELLQLGHVCGSVIGGRQLDLAVFVPTIYGEAIARWVTQQFAQNRYVETSAVRKLGWTEDVSKMLASDQPVVLTNCFLDKELWESFKVNIQAFLEANGWVDVMAHMDLHNVLSKEDCNKMIDLIVGTKNKKKGGTGNAEELLVCEDSHLCYPNKIQAAVIDLFSSEIKARAVLKGPELIKQLKAKEHCQAAIVDDFSANVESKKKGGRGGKKGGKGANADNKRKQAESGDSSITDTSLEFMSTDEIKEFLAENWQADCPEVVMDEMCSLLKPVLNASFRECVESVFLSSDSGSKTSMKKTHADFDEKYRILFQNIYMFDTCAGQYFEGTTTDQLKGLLLRGFCTDLVNLAVSYVGGVDINSKLTPKIRDATVDSLPPSAKEAFQRLVASLAKKDSLTEFLTAAEETAGLNVCGVALKYPDKRARAELVANYAAELKVQLLENSDDAPRSLIVILLLLFSHCSEGAMLHASGKFVPQIVLYLRGKIDATLHQNISLAQELVMKSLTGKGGIDNQERDDQLAQVITQLKTDVKRIC